MSYEERRIDWDSYYDPPEDEGYEVAVWVEPGSEVDAAIMAYIDKNGGTEETAVLGLIEAGFTSMLENDALNWTGRKEQER